VVAAAGALDIGQCKLYTVCYRTFLQNVSNISDVRVTHIHKGISVDMSLGIYSILILGASFQRLYFRRSLLFI